MKSIALKIVLVLSACLSAPAFAWNQGGNPDYYTRGQVMQSGTVSPGVVVYVRNIRIESGNTAKALGAVGGALLGAVMANGRGYLYQGAAGVVGGAVGTIGANAIGTTEGIEIGVDMGNNQVRTVVQERGQYIPAVGQRVRVLQSGQETRIIQ